jgi:hypothetical protein
MALQLRRGSSGTRTGIVPAAGELIYTTDTKLVYVGDGTTAGGNIISGGLGDIVSDTSPQLGGNLDINGFSIVSAGNNNINIDADGSGDVVLQGSLTINEFGNFIKTGELNISPTTLTSFGNNNSSVDGNVYITRNSYIAGVAGFTYAQHHATADAVNFQFYRSRGTGVIPTAVVNGDDLADIGFVGHDGTNPVACGSISATVEGTPTPGRVPTKISFATDNGTNAAVRAELSAAGIWKVNNIAPLSGTTLSLTSGNLQLNAQGDLRFADADSSNYVAFQAPSTVSANVTWTLPDADGTAGYVLSTNGSGTLAWIAQTGGGGAGLQARSTVAVTTASLADAATGNVTFTGAAKGYVLYKIQTTGAAWVRIYTDISSRTADASRAEGVDPAAGAGVVAEVITTAAQTILVSPGTLGFNNESSPVTEIYAAVTNKTGGTATITVTLTILTIEV